ncbi:hypothetical protein CTAYLR_004632 [Chrysophaeum taylorii]|uniref:Uncharacterized protein n=1 Tax=Chrysophaeum taylorii TaxID=2483200 RepID=A0AAD7UPV1_9STRA|nr:hypothetical protein CTAYLR_004632 [Chrysophaeum taylorii]
MLGVAIDELCVSEVASRIEGALSKFVKEPSEAGCCELKGRLDDEIPVLGYIVSGTENTYLRRVLQAREWVARCQECPEALRGAVRRKFLRWLASRRGNEEEEEEEEEEALCAFVASVPEKATELHLRQRGELLAAHGWRRDIVYSPTFRSVRRALLGKPRALVVLGAAEEERRLRFWHEDGGTIDNLTPSDVVGMTTGVESDPELVFVTTDNPPADVSAQTTIVACVDGADTFLDHLLEGLFRAKGPPELSDADFAYVHAVRSEGWIVGSMDYKAKIVPAKPRVLEYVARTAPLRFTLDGSLAFVQEMADRLGSPRFVVEYEIQIVSAAALQIMVEDLERAYDDTVVRAAASNVAAAAGADGAVLNKLVCRGSYETLAALMTRGGAILPEDFTVSNLVRVTIEAALFEKLDPAQRADLAAWLEQPSSFPQQQTPCRAVLARVLRQICCCGTSPLTFEKLFHISKTTPADPRKARALRRAERATEIVSRGLETAANVLAAAATEPRGILAEVCRASTAVLRSVGNLKKKTDDAVEAARRVGDVLLILRMMVAAKHRGTEKEELMQELKMVLSRMNRLLEDLGGSRYLERMIIQSAELGSLDRDVKRSLDAIKKAYNLALDAKSTTYSLSSFEEAREYPVEAVIKKFVDRRVRFAQKPEPAVRLDLARDPDFAHVIARTGNLDLEIVYDHLDSLSQNHADDRRALVKTQAAKLATACFAGDVALVRRVVASGLVTMGWEVTTLHLACIGGSLEVVKLLVEEHGASPSHSDQNQRTPFYHATAHDSLDVADYLLNECRGVHVDAADIRRRTPLMRAAAEARVRTVDWLLRHGANPNLADPKDLTALDYATKAETHAREAVREEQQRLAKLKSSSDVDDLVRGATKLHQLESKVASYVHVIRCLTQSWLDEVFV